MRPFPQRRTPTWWRTIQSGCTRYWIEYSATVGKVRSPRESRAVSTGGLTWRPSRSASGSALGLRVGQVIVKLFFGGVESAPAALNARTSNAYLPGLRCL